MKIIGGLVVGIVALVMSAPAYAHHNTISGDAECQDDGTYSVTWTITNSEWQTNHATETITASSRPWMIPVGTAFSFHYATVTEVVAGNTTSLILTLTARWSNGNTATNSGGASGFRAGCFPTPPPSSPPPPPPDASPPPHYAPHASLQGPCGDPMYRAVYDNTRSNRAVTFRFRYYKFTVGYVTAFRRVQAHRRVVGRYAHVRQRTIMTISARGRVLVQKRSAPGSLFPACVA